MDWSSVIQDSGLLRGKITKPSDIALTFELDITIGRWICSIKTRECTKKDEGISFRKLAVKPGGIQKELRTSKER